MKKLLLDSHALIWFFEEDSRLPLNIKDLIEDAKSDIFVSVASFWEIAIKKSLGKLTLAKSISEMFLECEIQDIFILPISQKDVAEVELLPMYHRDPFNRIIIATAITNGFDIVSIDTQFDGYQVNRILQTPAKEK
jgi:PIN domain nuclease of toxin-antitoxin system